MNIKAIRNKIDNEIETKCPYGMHENRFKNEPVYKVGGWNCEKCKHFKEIKVKDNDECTVVCDHPAE